MKFNFFSQHNPEILAQLIQQKNLPLVDGDLNVEEHHQNNVNSNYLLITNHGKITVILKRSWHYICKKN